MAVRRRHVTMPAVERSIVRRRGSDSSPTIVSKKPEPRRAVVAVFPEAGAIDELFREAKRKRA